MPPKAAATGASETENITALCHLMAACTDFKVDTSQLTTVLNISHARNVPRKINGIINPVGFEFRGGRVIAKDDEASVPATPTKNTGSDDDPKTTTPKSKPSTPITDGKKKNTPKTNSNKKRKVEATDKSSSDNDISKSDDDIVAADTKIQELSGEDKKD